MSCCRFCEKSFENPQRLQQHQSAKHWTDLHWLQKHHSEFHGLGLILPIPDCSICIERFGNKQKIQAYIKAQSEAQQHARYDAQLEGPKSRAWKPLISNESSNASRQALTMPEPSQSVWLSKPFRFSVRGTIFYLHPQLVASRSEPLSRLMNGYMSEADEKVAVIEDVAEETFNHFCQWLYTGFYKALESEHRDGSPRQDPLPDTRLCHGNCKATKMFDHDNTEALKPESVDTAIAEEWLSIHEDVKLGSSQEVAKSFFCKLEICGSATRFKAGQHECEDEEAHHCAQTLLSHAHLYVFAENYHIQDLKSLTLRNLHQCLSKLNLTSENVDEVVNLVHFVYTNTNYDEPIRSLVRFYIGCEMKLLSTAKPFADLLHENIDLCRDFLSLVEHICR